MPSMQFDREKLKTVILYTCSESHPSNLGAVKLHRVLYCADMLHYAFTGTPITGATYRKRPFGPACDQLLPTLRELMRGGDVEIKRTDYFGYWKTEYIARRSPDLQRLGDEEIGLLDEVIVFVCANNTAKTISEFSHDRAWEMAEFGSVLSYHSAFHLFPTQVSQEAMDWAAGEVSRIAAAGPHNETMGGTTLRDFRRSR